MGCLLPLVLQLLLSLLLLLLLAGVLGVWWGAGAWWCGLTAAAAAGRGVRWRAGGGQQGLVRCGGACVNEWRCGWQLLTDDPGKANIARCVGSRSNVLSSLLDMVCHYTWLQPRLLPCAWLRLSGRRVSCSTSAAGVAASEYLMRRVSASHRQ